MRRASMRPNFELVLDGDGSEFFGRLRERLRAADAPFVGEVLRSHAYLRIPRDRRSMLSPNLNLDVEPEDRGPAVLHARFTPHPSVWMAFMGVFCVLGMIGLSGLVWGLAQLTVDGDVRAIWLAPLSLALIAFVYGAAFIGQGLVVDEMYALRAFVESLVREGSDDPS